ncbi:hypothetical protein DRO53_01495 [Candidatus Bathyarchaeota archaeon]|nr:MAG: hypothetical protein DRO53_01495 [Candidatus Bathyarchaeota archaeon]
MTAKISEAAEAGDLVKQIESLGVEIAELKEQRDKLNNEAREWLRKGESLVEESRRLKQETRSLRDEVRKLRDEAARLKSELSEVRGRLSEKCRLRDELRSRIKELRSKVSIPKEKAEKLFEELEWHIQTNPLPAEEERRLLEKIKNLESQLDIHGRIEELVEQLNRQRQDIQALKEQADRIKAELDKIYGELKEKIGRVEELSKRVEAVEEEAKEAYRHFAEAKLSADRLHSRIVELLNKQRSLKDELRKRRKGKEEEALERILRELEEAYRQGKKKKLTLEEFKLLMSRGLI